VELKEQCECPDQGAHQEREGHGYCNERWTELVMDLDGQLHLCRGCADGSAHEPQEDEHEAV